MTEPLHIKFVAKGQESVRERIRAVVWAADQNDFTGRRNVTNELAAWLRADGYPIPQERVHDAMDWLHKGGYAIRVVNGKRTTDFMLADGLVVEKPGYVKVREQLEAQALHPPVTDPQERLAARRERRTAGTSVVVAPSAEVAREAGRQVGAAIAHATRVQNGQTPTPARRRPPVPLMNEGPEWAPELAELTEQWWREDPGAADDWAGETLAALRGRG